MRDDSCVGSLVTNNGTLSLTGVTVTGAKHGAAINNVTAGSTPARLTVTWSTIEQNSNDGVAGDGAEAAGISSTGRRAGQGQVKVVNSTIADNQITPAFQNAGGVYTNSAQTGAVTLIGDTITANNGGDSAGGVFDSWAGGSATPVLLSNTVIAGNTTTNTNPPTPPRIARARSPTARAGTICSAARATAPG